MRTPLLFLFVAACSSAPERRGGSISIDQELCTGERCFVSAGASFSEAGDRCRRSEVAGCRVTECGNVVGGSFHEVNAGDITVSGVPGGNLTLQYEDGAYERASMYGRGLNAGDRLIISSSGGELPAFSGEVVVPRGVMLTSPECSSVSCGSISRSADFPLSWTGAKAAEVIVTSMKPNERWVIVQCELERSPGVVPAAALRRLHASEDGYTVSLFVSPRSKAVVVVGEWELELRAQTHGQAGLLVTSD